MNVVQINITSNNVTSSGPSTDGTATVSLNTLFAKDSQAKSLCAAVVTALNAQYAKSTTPISIKLALPSSGTQTISADWMDSARIQFIPLVGGSAVQVAVVALKTYLAGKSV
jgi:hypothetical protein